MKRFLATTAVAGAGTSGKPGGVSVVVPGIGVAPATWCDGV